MPKIKKLTLDFSTLNEFRLCPRKAILNYAYGYKRAGARFSANLYKGKVLHQALEALYSGQPITITKWAAEQGISDSSLELSEIVRDYATFYNAGPGHDSEFIPLRQEHWSEAHLVDEIYFGGSIDQLARNHAGELLISDTKCSSSVETYVFPKIDVSEQFSGYAWLAAKELNEPVFNVMVNGISLNPKVRGANKFARRWTIRQPWQIAEWHANTVYWARLFRDALTGVGPTGTACDHGIKTFNTECHLADFCKAAPEDRPGILLNNYQVEPWEGCKVEWDTSA